MGGAHSHSAHDLDHVEAARVPRLVLLVSLALAALATVIGTVVLWPDEEPPTTEYAAEGVTFVEATVVSVGDLCPVIVVDPSQPSGDVPDFPQDCQKAVVELENGEQRQIDVSPAAAASGLGKGDTVDLVRIPATGEIPEQLSFYGVDRDFPLLVLAVLFVVVVGLVARLRGLLALLGLGIAGLVVWKFMLPALLVGGSGVGVALVGSAAIMFVVLYLAHGPSVRTSTALAGTLVGTVIIAALGEYAVRAALLGGLGGEGMETVRRFAPDLDLRGVLTCAVIIAGLGVLNDVTITQSSAVWELRAAGPELTRRQLFASGMRIGRDHIASTIYTIVFAYAGTAIAVLLLASLYDRGTALLSDEAVAEEVVRTIAAGIGLVLAVPVTTAIAAATVAGPTARAGTSAAPS